MTLSRTLMLLVAANLALAGCAARSTVQMVQAEQALYLARQAEAPERAVFEWTLAEQYMEKAREEWSHSDYGPADDLARKAIDWAQKAEAAASDLESYERMETSPDVVPEERETGASEPVEGETLDEEPWGEEERGIEHETIEVPDVDLFEDEEEDE